MEVNQNIMKKITNTVFKSPKISFEVKGDDYRFVKSTRNIRKGELLLIEHCFCTENNAILHTVIKSYSELFNNLYPRKLVWSENIAESKSKEIDDLCSEKGQKNCFGADDGYSTIGVDISNFNHSNTPNAVTKNQKYDFVSDKVPSCNLTYVYSQNDIGADTEITIYYSNEYINKHFGENITEEYKPSFELEKHYIKNIGIQYIKKDICKNILFHHCCINYGIYFISSELYLMTPRFIEFFTKKIKKEPITENIMQWCFDLSQEMNVLLHLSVFD
jgi:hypothetical protein